MAADGEVLAEYGFSDESGAGTMAATVTGSNVTAEIIDDGTYETVYVTNGYEGVAYGGTRDALGMIDGDDGNNIIATMTDEGFLEFTITAGSNHRLSLNSISFRMFVENKVNSADRWMLFSSVDSYLEGYQPGAEIASGQVTDEGVWDGDSNLITVNLEEAKFQGLDTISFRIYLYGTEEEANSITAVDNIVVTGVSAVRTPLLGYDFTNGTVYEASEIVSRITASDLNTAIGGVFKNARGDLSGLDGQGSVFGVPNQLGGLFITGEESSSAGFGDAVSNDDYVSFSVTPDEGSTYNIDSLSFKAIRQNGNVATTVALANSAGEMIGSAITLQPDTGNITSAYYGYTVSLEGTELENIEDSTELRLYFWGGAVGTNGSLGLDKITLHGAVINSSGRNSNFWAVLKPNAGTDLAVDTDLVLRNGYREVDLSASELSCERVDNGSEFIYNITWTGNNFDGDINPDILEFSIVVDAFTGSSYVYNDVAGESSMTSLGSTTDVVLNENAWSVGTNATMGAGETLQFSTANVMIGGTNVSSLGVTVSPLINSISLIETNGGNSHKIVIGEGTNLNSHFFSLPTNEITLVGEESASLTSAGSANGNGWAVSGISFSLNLLDPSMDSEDPHFPYSDLAEGDLYAETPYSPTSQEKIEDGFPEFSWDRIPRTTLIRKNIAYTDDEIERMAKLFDLVILEKANSAGFDVPYQGVWDTASRLKEHNPDIKVVFYLNSRIYFSDYGISTEMGENYDAYIHPTFTIRNSLPTINRSNPDVVDWWKGVIFKMIGLDDGLSPEGIPYSTSPLDGVFVDKAGIPISMLKEVYDELPSNKIMMNNNNGDRSRISQVDGTYREDWRGDDIATIVSTIATAQELGQNQKMTTLRNPWSASSQREVEDNVELGLGFYLIYAEKYGYYNHFSTVDATEEDWGWLTDYLDQGLRPLGEPLGHADQDGSVYARSFEHCDAYVNIVEDIDDEIQRVLWKNNVGSPALDGEGYSKTDGTYVVQGSGAISGIKDEFFFLSDLHNQDGYFSSRVDSLTGGSANALAGVMFRDRNEATETDPLAYKEQAIEMYAQGEVITGEASMVAVMRDVSGDMNMLYRNGVGTEVQSAGLASADLGSFAKIERVGDEFTGYCSTDGVTWRVIGSVNITMGEKIEMGMAVTSGGEGLASATFSSYDREEIDFDADPLDYYQTWVESFGDISDTGYDADPDSDGIANLLEYVLGGSPTTDDTQLLPNIIETDSGYTFEFNRSVESAEVTNQYIQYSADLFNWSDDLQINSVELAPFVELGATVGGLQPVKISFDTDYEEDKRLFGRFKVVPK
ncbi:MAG: putative glycoside hydrolase [Akkermansiaceae bacterium]